MLRRLSEAVSVSGNEKETNLSIMVPLHISISYLFLFKSSSPFTTNHYKSILRKCQFSRKPFRLHFRIFQDNYLSKVTDSSFCNFLSESNIVKLISEIKSKGEIKNGKQNYVE